jgi:hypothetical protein
MEIILIPLLILGFVFIFKWALDIDNHYKWVHSLKPGDMVQVEIFSNHCECNVEAMVVSEPQGKYIEAEISTDMKKECENCHKANDTCLYNVNVFHRSLVNKLPE